MTPALSAVVLVVVYLALGLLVFFVERARVSCEAWTRYPTDTKSRSGVESGYDYNETRRKHHIREEDSSGLLIFLWPIVVAWLAAMFVAKPLIAGLRYVILDGSENLGKSCAMRKKGRGSCNIS